MLCSCKYCSSFNYIVDFSFDTYCLRLFLSPPLKDHHLKFIFCNCQAQVQFQVPNPSHIFKSKKLKSKVQRKRNGTGADTIILQATHPTHPPPTHNFSHLKFDLQTSMRGLNGVEFYQEYTGHVGFFLALLLADQ